MFNVSYFSIFKNNAVFTFTVCNFPLRHKMHPHILLPMLSIIATLSLESLTARKYSHINETTYISEKCNYTFLPKPPLPYNNLCTFNSYLLSEKSRSSAHSKSTFVSFSDSWPLEIIKDNKFTGAGISVLPLQMVLPFIFIHSKLHAEWKITITDQGPLCESVLHGLLLIQMLLAQLIPTCFQE